MVTAPVPTATLLVTVTGVCALRTFKVHTTEAELPFPVASVRTSLNNATLFNTLISTAQFRELEGPDDEIGSSRLQPPNVALNCMTPEWNFEIEFPVTVWDTVKSKPATTPPSPSWKNIRLPRRTPRRPRSSSRPASPSPPPPPPPCRPAYMAGWQQAILCRP